LNWHVTIDKLKSFIFPPPYTTHKQIAHCELHDVPNISYICWFRKKYYCYKCNTHYLGPLAKFIALGHGVHHLSCNFSNLGKLHEFCFDEGLKQVGELVGSRMEHISPFLHHLPNPPLPLFTYWISIKNKFPNKFPNHKILHSHLG